MSHFCLVVIIIIDVFVIVKMLLYNMNVIFICNSSLNSLLNYNCIQLTLNTFVSSLQLNEAAPQLGLITLDHLIKSLFSQS